MAAAFCISGKSLESIEEFLNEMIGLKRIFKYKENAWLLVFEDKEQAEVARWNIELHGGVCLESNEQK